MSSGILCPFFRILFCVKVSDELIISLHPDAPQEEQVVPFCFQRGCYEHKLFSTFILRSDLLETRTVIQDMKSKYQRIKYGLTC